MQSYDYIVVGAGSAGAAVAHRLSADPRNKVLLLEAGPASHPWSWIPIGFARLINNPKANWLYTAEPEAHTNGRRLPVPRGKMLGGSSSINGMAFVRGQAQDFDTWAQMGNTGWSYADVLPVFKRMERYEGGGDDTYRGREGPLRITDPQPTDTLYAALIEAAGQVGIRHNPDYNGATQDGIAMSQASIANGKRMSTARCYLDPIRSRQNLHIQADALTEALTFDGTRCTGVRYRVGDTIHTARCEREVVVSAGSINSPQLLELSGIGQAERLQVPGHRGGARPARRRREPARPFRPAHPLGDRQARHHLQRSCAGHRAGRPGIALCADRTRACWAWWRRRCGPSSAPATGWRRPTCCWAGCRC